MIPKSRTRWWVLIAMSLSLSMLFLDQTAISVALPAIQKDLDANNAELQWMVNAYLLTTASFLILGGKLGDIIGHKRLFLFGLVLFIGASIGTAISHIELTAIINRAIQGCGSAFMIPTAIVIIFSVFHDKERGRAMGIRVAIASTCLSLGPIVGGLFTEFLNWRWIFWINCPIGLVCGLITYYHCPKLLPHHDKQKIDWLGFTLLLSGMFCIIFAIMQSAHWGWDNLTTYILLGGGAFILYLFFQSQKNNAAPFIDLRLFQNKKFVTASLILFLVQTNFIARVFIFLYFQLALGFSPVMAGVLALPSALIVIVSGPLGGILSDKYGPRMPLLWGTACIILGSLWAGLSIWSFNYWWFLPGFILFAFGAPFVIPTCNHVALENIDKKNRGVASGVCNAARNIGGTLGLAVFSTIIYNVERIRLQDFINHSPPPLHQLQASQLSGLLAGTSDATQATAHLPTMQLHQLHTAAAHAFTFGLSISMLVISLLATAGFALAWRLR